MQLVSSIVAALAFMALILTLINAVSIWQPARSSKREGADVSLLIPMRNEARNVEPLFASISASMAQESHRNTWEVIVLDDQSKDATRALLDDQIRQVPELRIISGEDLPDGWLGKPAASQRLFSSASGRFLVFIDADVRLEPGAISAAIAVMEKNEWDFVSPYPRQIALSFMERVIQPLLQWSWFASVPLRLAARLRTPSMAVANGQFFIVTREALDAIGGFTSVKGEVLEDIELARQLWRAGFSGSVIDGSAIAHCRMYNDGKELIEGYSKSLWRAFGSPFGASIALTLMIATSWLPLILGLLGSAWGWLAYFAVSLSRLIAALRTRSFWQSFLLHPISVAILLFMVLRSFHLKRRGALTWRDRSVTL
jgi:cellulose synthase/poly-beta-1,6-N-acetylglucosamine synthase-like glycosyltransferase